MESVNSANSCLSSDSRLCSFRFAPVTSKFEKGNKHKKAKNIVAGEKKMQPRKHTQKKTKQNKTKKQEVRRNMAFLPFTLKSI
jgi:hypothetical protein